MSNKFYKLQYLLLFSMVNRENVKYGTMLALTAGCLATTVIEGYYHYQVQNNTNKIEALSVLSDARNLRDASGLEFLSQETRQNLYTTLDRTIEEVEQHPQVVEMQRQNEVYHDKSNLFLGLTLLPTFGFAALFGKMVYDISRSRREREEMNRRERAELVGSGRIA